MADLKTEPLAMEQGLDKLKQLSLVYQEDDQYKVLPITREYALVELAKYPTVEQEARERWIKYYLEFTEKYGGADWEDWRVKYDVLEEEWKNIIQLLDWCGANGRYQDVVTIWNNIDNYIDLKEEWDIRLKWSEWLEKQSKQRFNSAMHQATSPNAVATYIHALATQAWIFILKGSEYFPNAQAKLEAGWKIKEENECIFLAKASLAIIHSILLKIQREYDSSLSMLEEAENLIQQANTQDSCYQRCFIRIFYYRAEIYCCRQYQKQNLETAKSLFNQVCQEGQNIEWSRIVNYAENDLANIAIQEQEYETAHTIIERGLMAAKSHREKRRIGHWLTSHWRLELEQNNLVEAEDYATKALRYFENSGGFINDVHEIQSWLKTIHN